MKSLKEFSRKFDGYEGPIRITNDEMEMAASTLDRDARESIGKIMDRVREVHEKQVPRTYISERGGSLFGILERPLERIGIYVPGGKPLPSSIIMTAVPAIIAGVKEIVVCSPPRGGSVDSAILYIAHKLGISEVYRLGGAQSIASMAYGVGMDRVQKIFGPGSAIVTEAKRQVYGKVGIDGLNGPSEICIIADDSADPGYVSADLSSQLEHGLDSRAWLLTTSRTIYSMTLVDGVDVELLESMDRCVERANELAPEHLEILARDPLSLLGKVRNAGAIYLGPYTPVPAGDYFLGVNHVLPTAGSAAFASALTVWDFMKISSFAMAGRGDYLSSRSAGMKMAEIEGMGEHRNSIGVRK